MDAGLNEPLMSFSMTFNDPNPGFKVTVYLKVEYLKNGAF